MIEQGVILQGNIDITIFGEDDLTITSNYENCDKLSLNQIAKRHRDLEITHIYCEDGRLQIDLKENKKVIEFLDLIFVKKENYVNEYI